MSQVAIAPPAQPQSPLHNIDLLLRDAASILERIRNDTDLVPVARSMILTIALGAAAFGGSVGAYRGGLQILFAAIKLPLVLLLTTAVCAPALSALQFAVDRSWNLRRDVALVLSSLALTSLVLAAEAPVLLLAVSLKVSYHSMVLVLVGSCAVAGAVGLSLFVRGVTSFETKARWLVSAGVLAVFGLVGTQMSWTLRPYLVRPRTEQVPFARGMESNFVEAAITSLQSARGVYRRPCAPLPYDTGSTCGGVRGRQLDTEE